MKPIAPTLISFIHCSDEYREFFTSKDQNRPTFYWFTDRYYDHITSWKFSYCNYFYFFIKDPAKENIEFRSRHEGGKFNGLYKHYLTYENWIKRKEYGLKAELALMEPGILYSFSRITPDLIAKYDHEKKQFEVVFPESVKGSILDLFYPNGLSKNFLETKLLQIFPHIKDSLPLAKASKNGDEYNFINWCQMPGDPNRGWL